MKQLIINAPYMVRLAILRGALRLEVAGMKRSRTPTVYAMVKKEFNLKGNKQSVLDQFCMLYEYKKRDYLLGIQEENSTNALH
jgi:hypothetical protein